MREQFREYLIKKGYKENTFSGNPSTVYDYIKRIDFVCNEENTSWELLANDISSIVSLYDKNGLKESLGNKSHRAVINALKQFQLFLLQENL